MNALISAKETQVKKLSEEMVFDRVAFSGPRQVLLFWSKNRPGAVEAGLLNVLYSSKELPTTLVLGRVSFSGPKQVLPLQSQSRPEAVEAGMLTTLYSPVWVYPLPSDPLLAYIAKTQPFLTPIKKLPKNYLWLKFYFMILEII